MDQERSTGSGRFNFFSRLPAQKPYHHSPAHRPGYDGPMLEPVFPGAFPTAPTPPTTHFAHKPPPQPYARYAHTAPPPPQVRFACDICNCSLSMRPRIHCVNCANFDLCTTCYLTRRTKHPHETWHQMQTVLPPVQARYQHNSGAAFSCNVCYADCSAAPRARCLECINFDICGDCHVMQVEGPPGQGHIPTHKMNVIVDWTPETTEKLVNDDYYPSNLYLDMIDAIFNFIHKQYNPPIGGGLGESAYNPNLVNSPSTRSAPGTPVRDRSAGGSGAGVAGAGVLSESGPVPREHRVEFEVLEASKLARFYRAMGMNDQDNSYLIGSAQLSSLYSRLGLEYILIPSPSLRASLSDRTFPWQIDNLDTTPSEPALTRSGFRRSFVLGTFLNPAGTHYILQNLLSTGKLVNPITEVPFKASVPRETLPKEPLEDLLAWERGMGI